MKPLYLLMGIFFLSFILYDRFTIDKLNQELTEAQDQIEQMVKTNTFERKRKQLHFIHRDAAREKVFSLLYELNKETKRVKYVPGELLIEDLSLGENDQFLDLLDLLFEQEQLVMIEIPDNKKIKSDLKLAGFSSDFISLSKDGQWRIRIKE